MDDVTSLRLQWEWGADEALETRPVDRRAALAPPPLPPAGKPATRVPPGQAQAEAAAAAASTLDALHQALAAFEGCALRATATNLVFAEGDPTARLVLIADVPGASEDRAGTPFAGPAAVFLERMFASAGLDRSAWRCASLLPWRPPGDRKPTEQEIQLCLPFLHRHLALLRPRRAIVLGNLGSRVLLADGGRRARNVWHDMAVPGLERPVPTLALPSLAHIHATPPAKRAAWADLMRLRRALEGDEADHK